MSWWMEIPLKKPFNTEGAGRPLFAAWKKCGKFRFAVLQWGKRKVMGMEYAVSLCDDSQADRTYLSAQVKNWAEKTGRGLGFHHPVLG